MTPHDWQKAMQNEANAVEDDVWSEDTLRYAHSQILLGKVLPLAVSCLSVLTFPSILAMTYGDFSQPGPIFMGLCVTWISLVIGRYAARNLLGRVGFAVMGAVGIIFTLAFIVPFEGTTAILWLLGFPTGAFLACLGSKWPYCLPLALLALPLGVWFLINGTPWPLLTLQDRLTDVALFVAQAGWLWLSLLLLRQRSPT